jgi:hypothetical protein
MNELIKLTEPNNEDLTRHYFVKLVGGGIGAFNGKGRLVYTYIFLSSNLAIIIIILIIIIIIAL